jgi:prevent-host-death family protein
MTIILVMSETRSLADVKAHFSEIVDLVAGQHERVVVTRYGKPAAVIMSPDDLESLEETLAILSSPGALDEIRAAESDLKTGEFLTAAKLKAKYLPEK